MKHVLILRLYARNSQRRWEILGKTFTRTDLSNTNNIIQKNEELWCPDMCPRGKLPPG